MHSSSMLKSIPRNIYTYRNEVTIMRKVYLCIINNQNPIKYE